MLKLKLQKTADMRDWPFLVYFFSISWYVQHVLGIECLRWAQGMILKYIIGVYITPIFLGFNFAAKDLIAEQGLVVETVAVLNQMLNPMWSCDR